MHLGQRKPWRIALAVAATLAATTAARADITTTFSGFGTVGGTFTSNSDFAYKHDASEYTGATNQVDIGLESRLGLQAKIDFGSGFSITAQEVFRQRGSNEFDPGTEWLYVQYSPTSDLEIRMGRVVLPVFLYSDSRQVGYAAPWFRSPNEVYGEFPFNYVDGGQLTWQKSLGQFTVALQGTVGSTSGTFQDGTLTIQTNAKDIYNESLSVTYGDLLVRVAQTTLSVPNSLQLTPTFTLSYEEHGTFLTAGAQYDNGKAVIIGEWADTKQNNAPIFNEPLTASKSWYASAGWRFDKFLPLVTYGSVHQEQSLLSAPYTKGAWSAGLRYDVVSNVALKAEVSRAQESNGLYFVTTNLTSSQYVNVYSIGADFVF
jgi:Gram-negative porin